MISDKFVNNRVLETFSSYFHETGQFESGKGRLQINENVAHGNVDMKRLSLAPTMRFLPCVGCVSTESILAQ